LKIVCCDKNVKICVIFIDFMKKETYNLSVLKIKMQFHLVKYSK
jgi:hypothetical protein